ncbi:hypothetical protein KP014_17680 [Paenibacillus sophorae]|uniref:Uncharacterized protein n=2 Tax=Paenibacillus sophorae TaxID=1333845 RepID=A0ABX8H9S2_9BACL|nr:hypothetical protein KP014_17680 [Paenibacillus sophorae]
MEQRERIEDFFLILSDRLRNPNLDQDLHEVLRKIRLYHKFLPMPESRKELEDCASFVSQVRGINMPPVSFVAGSDAVEWASSMLGGTFRSAPMATGDRLT